MATSLKTEMNRDGFRLTYSSNGDYAGFIRSAPNLKWIAVPIGVDAPCVQFNTLEAAEFYCLAYACEANEHNRLHALGKRWESEDALNNASEPSCELATRCSDMPRE